MQIRNLKRSVQKGFTLVELIIVIVILGILAAVAIPNLTSTSDSAYVAKQDATLGALKTAWSIAYASNKASPNASQIASAMTDPSCSATAGVITCSGVTKKDGTTAAQFPTGATDNTTAIASPATITSTGG